MRDNKNKNNKKSFISRKQTQTKAKPNWLHTEFSINKYFLDKNSNYIHLDMFPSHYNWTETRKCIQMYEKEQERDRTQMGEES